MRLKAILAATAVLAMIGISMPDHASASERDRPDGWGRTRDVHHRAYYPHSRHVYNVDPYAYQYSPRGYYPYYGSAYWSPTAYVRKRNRLHYNVWNTQPPQYRFYQSWGYPKTWNNRAWHETHHGRHRPWHW